MKPNHPSSRAQAAALLSRVLQEKITLDEALGREPLQGGDADTRFTMMLVLTTLRHLGQIDALLKNYLAKPLPPKRATAQNALRIGVSQLMLMQTPAHAAVHETVALVKASKDNALAGLVNAVLQKITREQPVMPSPLANIPDWLRRRWAQAYGESATETMAEIAAQRPPLDLVGAKDFTGGARLDPHVYRLPPSHESVAELEGYGDGAFWVQDVAATYPVRLLGEIHGLSVLDLGAAPGGKTAQLARAGATVTALDKSAARMDILRQNMARLKLTPTAEVADMLAWEPKAPFDIVLLDAPCSATGTWRRHPELLAVTTQHDITELARQQRAMLARAWGWVKPGGRMVYCTCSLEAEEGEQQAHWFLEHHAGATLEAPAGDAIPAEALQGSVLRTRPDMLAEQGGMDGFFAAVFRKPT